jgi:hypothetical protein
MTARWVRTYSSGGDYIESLGGVLWSDAGLPLRWHWCVPQTRGRIGLTYSERCRCGAIRLRPTGLWLDKNQTRRHRRMAAREARLPRVTVTCRRCGKPYEAGAGTAIARSAVCTPCWAQAMAAWFRSEG